MATLSLKSSHDRMSLIKVAVNTLDSDVEIVCSEGDILLANSFLLSKASPFLQSLLLPLLPTDSQTSARIHLPDVSKRSLSHLLNILKQGFSTGPGTGNSIKQEVQETAKALRFTELSALTISLNNEYIEEAGDDYEQKIKSERIKSEGYCILCQMDGHTISEACVVNAQCLECGVKGHVRRDCKEQKPDFKNKIKGEVKGEYEDLKQETDELKGIREEIKRGNRDYKDEKFDVKDIKLEAKKENIKYDEDEYVEWDSPKEEEKENDSPDHPLDHQEAQEAHQSPRDEEKENDNPDPPLAHQEVQQPSNSYSPRGNKAGPAKAARKLPNRNRNAFYGSLFETTKDGCPKVQKEKKKRSKLDDKAHDDDKYRCTKCDFKSKHKSNVRRHHEAVHDKVKYPCPECDYKASQQSSLNAHIKAIHEGVKYQCPECDYKASQQSSLNTHIKSIHEGVKYSCSECDYEATHQNNLHVHIKSVHEGVKYSCSKCDYEATQQSSLNTHIKSVHEGVVFPCTSCNYKATHRSNLIRHVKRVHNKRKRDSDSEDMMSPQSATNRKKAKKSSAMTPDVSLQPSASTTDDPDSDSSQSSHSGKKQPKRKVKENKKISVENDLIDIDDTDNDEDYDPELE